MNTNEYPRNRGNVPINIGYTVS